MKTNKNIFLSLIALSIIVIYSCNTVSNSEPDISDEDLEIAGEIIAQSLSEVQGGMLSSVYDAFSNISQTGITYSVANQIPQKTNANSSHRPGRGGEKEFSADYNPETGEHTISFRRYFERPNFTKNLSVLNKYIFTDVNQEFLQWPKRQSDLIETIVFKGLKSGTALSDRRSSSFTRVDTLFASGISDGSTIITLDGKHNGEGQMTVELPQLERSGGTTYNLQFEFQNIQIDKAIVRENGNMEEGITGLITHRMQMTRTNKDGETTEETLSGTIELTGDGTALLRFDSFKKTLSIAIKNGIVMQ